MMPGVGPNNLHEWDLSEVEDSTAPGGSPRVAAPALVHTSVAGSLATGC